MKFNVWLFFILIIFSQLFYAQERVVAVIENDADSKPISNVHVINLNSVVGTISNKDGIFEIDANVNDTLFLSTLNLIDTISRIIKQITAAISVLNDIVA